MNPQIAKPAFYFALALSLALSRQSAAQSAPVPEFCPAPDTAGLLIRFFDVGQGDATLLTTSEGRHVLVDGGPHPTRALGYLSALGVDTIALLIASHHHLDHIGGLPAILDSLTVTNVVENGLPATTRIYANLVSALERSGARVLRAEARELGVGSLQIRIIPPWARFRSQNLASVGAVATFGAFRVLFTGDAEERALRSWTSQGVIPPVTVVKVGHHGARNGTTPELVHATRPRMAIVSVAARNSYGHPSPSVVAEWSAAHAQVLRTDEHGTIVVRGCSDGSYSVLTSTPSVLGRKQ
jgi:competence protein ComEC